MSIATEITRINNAKAAIKASVAQKGVDIPESALLSVYSEYIDQIEQGGGESKWHHPDPLWLENRTTSQVLILPEKDYFIDLEYKIDDGEWTPFTSNKYLPAGSKMYLRAQMMLYNTSSHISCVTAGALNVGGNPLSIIESTKGKLIPYAFNGLFYNNKGVYDISALDLSSTTLTDYCYYNMFYNCSNLKILPDNMLPATSLKTQCYGSMFAGCASLVTPPALPATTLANYCYNKMFGGCTNLLSAPTLPATTLATSCYSYMFDSCTNLASAPALPATTLQSSCYNYMFRNCKALTTAPDLMATTLVSSCYYYMFNGCSNLESIRVGATAWNTSYANSWVTSVKSSGTFTKPSGTTIATGTSGIPSGWTVVNE